MNSFLHTFLESCIKSGSANNPGLVRISQDNTGKLLTQPITGILESDVNISLQNRFGSIIPDISALSDWAAILGTVTVPTWIGSSGQVWKGTNPIGFGVNMILVNYAPGLQLEEQLRNLAKLCTLMETEDKSAWRTMVHGGYSPDLFLNNKQYYADANGVGGAKDIYNLVSNKGMEEGTIENQFNPNISSGTNITGTLIVEIGSRFKLRNLLLTKIDITPSLVEVSEDGINSKPLYYRVGCSFQTCRVALEGDVDQMLGF